MFIKRPGNGRKSYALIGTDGKTLYDERIDRVNHDLAQGVAIDLLERRMRDIRDSFRRCTDLSIDNLKLAHACQEYKVKRKGKHLSRPEASRQRLLRAVDALGKCSLLAATEEEIIDTLVNVPVRSRYHIVGAVNELLGYAKRSLRIFNPAPPRNDEIAFIRVLDWRGAMGGMPEDYRTFLGALFATGCRIGELPRARIDGRIASIGSQLLRAGETAPTKNKVRRVAPLLPMLGDHIVAFLGWDQAKRDRIRIEHEARMRKVLRATLNIRIHDLRHSYCVEHGAAGASVFELADFIGDTVQVCARHYRPYCIQDEQIARALARFSVK